MTLITAGDFRETYFKLRQRGWQYFSKKFSLSEKSRTQATFNAGHETAANWWIVEAVRERWNYKISGNPKMDYETYLSNTHFKNLSNLQMLSPGCGSGSHELKFASQSHFSKVIAFDIAEKQIEAGKKSAMEAGLHNMEFQAVDLYEFPWRKIPLMLFYSTPVFIISKMWSTYYPPKYCPH